MLQISFKFWNTYIYSLQIFLELFFELIAIYCFEDKTTTI